jgi:hypothetical protein
VTHIKRTTVDAFVIAHHITARASQVGANPSMLTWTDADHWQVELTRAKEPASFAMSSAMHMTVFYSKGKGHYGKAPSVAEVIASLAMDSAIFSGDGMTFEEWAVEMGMDTDSRSAERTYHATKKQARDFRVFLGADLFAIACAGFTEEDSCSGCGAEGKYHDDLCYQCQCEAHADGSYDMDGDGLRVQ